MNNDPMLEIMKQAMIAEIGKNLNVEGRLVGEVVASVLNRKVNENGETESYDGYNKFSLLEWMVREAIEGVAKQAVSDWVKLKTADIEAQIRSALDTATPKLIQSIANQAIVAVRSDFRVGVDISLEPKPRSSDEE